MRHNPLNEEAARRLDRLVPLPRLMAATAEMRAAAMRLAHGRRVYLWPSWWRLRWLAVWLGR